MKFPLFALFRARRPIIGAVLCLTIVSSFQCGCSGWRDASGDLRTVSLTDQSATLPSRFIVGFFAPDRDGSTSFMLADAPVEQYLESAPQTGQILHIELLWDPLPGRTPMDSSATNVSLRLIIFAEGEVGIYSGAGFALPYSDPNESNTLTIAIRDATLQLEESTPGFSDLLGAAQMTGTCTVKRDEKKTRQLNRAASQLVTNALGRTRYVLEAR